MQCVLNIIFCIAHTSAYHHLATGKISSTHAYELKIFVHTVNNNSELRAMNKKKRIHNECKNTQTSAKSSPYQQMQSVVSRSLCSYHQTSLTFCIPSSLWLFCYSKAFLLSVHFMHTCRYLNEQKKKTPRKISRTHRISWNK